jgi:hypothetical protein
MSLKDFALRKKKQREEENVAAMHAQNLSRVGENSESMLVEDEGSKLAHEINGCDSADRMEVENVRSEELKENKVGRDDVGIPTACQQNNVTSAPQDPKTVLPPTTPLSPTTSNRLLPNNSPDPTSLIPKIELIADVIPNGLVGMANEGEQYPLPVTSHWSLPIVNGTSVSCASDYKPESTPPLSAPLSDPIITLLLKPLKKKEKF